VGKLGRRLASDYRKGNIVIHRSEIKNDRYKCKPDEHIFVSSDGLEIVKEK
jgi:hypothetical protein